MNCLIVDASVAVKWLPLFRDEPLVDTAIDYLDRFLAGQLQLLVPGLFWIEVASVLCKAVRRGACQPPEAEAALSALLDHGLLTLAPEELLAPALHIAIENNRSVYDSLYVALAVHAKAQLITADEKLANALAARFPIKWLGAL